MAKQVICTRCYTEGPLKKVTPGSGIIELALWLCLIVPGFIYSLIRLARRHTACGTCGCRETVELGTPAADRLRAMRARADEARPATVGAPVGARRPAA